MRTIQLCCNRFQRYANIRGIAHQSEIFEDFHRLIITITQKVGIHRAMALEISD